MVTATGLSEPLSESITSGTDGELGWWNGAESACVTTPHAIRTALQSLSESILLVRAQGQIALAAAEGTISWIKTSSTSDALPVVAFLPPMIPTMLGDPSFRQDHGVRLAYLTGAMANGIASCELVEAMGNAGMLGFFGAAGLSLDRIDAAIGRLSDSLKGKPFGFNLIHSPNEPHHEASTVDLYLRRGVRLVEASAYLDLTLPVVRYRLAGIHRDTNGTIVLPNKIIAKISRIEVARKFLSPPPERFLRELVEQGDLSSEQAELARKIPVAQDLTVEADSGGHTDNRPLIALLPTILALRDRIQPEYGREFPLRVGAAGGISTPASVAAAFAMGAAFVVTGSINQACVESGSSDVVREMLAQAEQADVTMAPAADMFEMGVKLQVLKRGTMFPMRAQKLYELYRGYSSLDEIPLADQRMLEKGVFRLPLTEVWRQTEEYFQRRDPSQIERARHDPKHKMSLVFRWYLGQSSRWANAGVVDRTIDYQVWCGPAMGAFNEWTRDSALADPKNRSVVTVALNLMIGAAMTTRWNLLQTQGVAVPREWKVIRPQLDVRQ